MIRRPLKFNDIEVVKNVSFEKSMLKINDLDVLKNVIISRSLEKISFIKSTFSDLEVHKNLMTSGCLENAIFKKPTFNHLESRNYKNYIVVLKNLMTPRQALGNILLKKTRLMT